MVLATGLLAACGRDVPEQDLMSSDPTSLPRFLIHGPERTGIDLSVQLHEDREINYFKYIYLYMTGGVAVGDLDGDSLPDVVISTAQQGCRVYRNLGSLRFTDVTSDSGMDVGGAWASGVVLADVNDDGALDIYVCTTGPSSDLEDLRNLLFINNGEGRFAERGREFGLDVRGNSQSAVFADLDGDGDLDAYVLGHRTDFHRVNEVITDPRFVPYEHETDRILIQEGPGRFIDRTTAFGMMNKGFSLGVAVGDLDQDGDLDLYVSNDFNDPDRFYVNDGQGRMRDRVNEHLKHCSYFGMGVDLADVNNDALPDLVQVDMTPRDHRRSKENMASMRPDQFFRMIEHGYLPQYMTNSLQVALGEGRFMEVAHLAGVDRTDWSWSPLLFDMDNDGWKDLFVSNGIIRDVTNSDFRMWADSVAAAGLLNEISYRDALARIPQHRPANNLFRNNGDLTFSPAEDLWGYHHRAVTTGAAYGDLDLDGDLDLVCVDQQEPVKVIENRTSDRADAHYIQFALAGSPGNRGAIGTTITLFTQDGRQHQELFTTRGFQSSSEPLLHFGLGGTTIDSVHVDWYDGTRTVLGPEKPDQRVSLAMDQVERRPRPTPAPAPTLLVAFNELPAHEHQENHFDDFAREILLPHRQSQHGPSVAVGDVNGDDLDDLLVTGSSGTSPTLYLSEASGTLRKAGAQPWSVHARSEFIGSVFFDADGDGDLDLYLAAGSTEFETGSEAYRDRLYLNDGQGRFQHDPTALPDLRTSTQVVVPFDMDGDGDLDLFVGGRNLPGAYPDSPPSHLLENTGNGSFREVTDAWFTNDRLGMITAGVARDMNGDGAMDLVLAGEWTSVMVWRNDGRLFTREGIAQPDQDLTGWWYGLALEDLDGDGAIDIVAGNLGLNNKFHPSREKPLKVYMGDLDSTGTNDIVLAKTSEHGELPVRGRECSSEQMPFIKERFPTYRSFAAADLPTLYGRSLEQAVTLQATEFRSMVFWGGDGGYQGTPLPNLAQVAPIRGILIEDLNEDGRPDLVVAGNMHGTEVETVSYDAGTGLVLLGEEDRRFRPLWPRESGFIADGDVRQLHRISTSRGEVFLVVTNDAPLRCYLTHEDLRTSPLTRR